MMRTTLHYQYFAHSHSPNTNEHRLTPLPLVYSQPLPPPPGLVQHPEFSVPKPPPLAFPQPIVHLQSQHTMQIQLPSVIAIFDNQKDIYQGLMLNCATPKAFLESTQKYRPEFFSHVPQFYSHTDTSGLRFHLYSPIVQRVFPWCDYIFLFHTGDEAEFQNKLNEISATGRPVKFYYVYDKSYHFVELNQFDPAHHTRSEIYCVNTSRIKGIMQGVLNQISSELVEQVNVSSNVNPRQPR